MFFFQANTWKKNIDMLNKKTSLYNSNRACENKMYSRLNPSGWKEPAAWLSDSEDGRTTPSKAITKAVAQRPVPPKSAGSPKNLLSTEPALGYKIKSGSKKGKAFWGEPYWITIHCACAAYLPERKREYLTFFSVLPFLLPCEECAAHLVENLKKISPEQYMSSNHDLFFWSYIIHDQVNRDHNIHKPDEPAKSSPPFEDVKNIYFRALSDECNACRRI
jgi:hypothetical protein